MVGRNGSEALLVVRARATPNPTFKEDIRPALARIEEARRAAFNTVVPESVRQAIIDLALIPAPDAKSKSISSPNFARWVVPGAPAQIEFGKRRFEHEGREYGGSFWVFGTVVEPGPHRQAMMTVEVAGKPYQVEGWRIFHVFDKPLIARDLSRPLPEYVDRMVALGRAPEHPGLPGLFSNPSGVAAMQLPLKRLQEIWENLIYRTDHEGRVQGMSWSRMCAVPKTLEDLKTTSPEDPARVVSELCYRIIVKDRPFGDCNHRTSLSATRYLLKRAGYQVQNFSESEWNEFRGLVMSLGVMQAEWKNREIVDQMHRWLTDHLMLLSTAKKTGSENISRMMGSSLSGGAEGRPSRAAPDTASSVAITTESPMEVIRASPNPSYPARLGLRDAISRAPIHSGSAIISRMMGSGSGPGGRGGAVNGNPVRCDSSISRRTSASHSSQDREDERSSVTVIRTESPMEVIRSSPNPHDPGPWTVRRTQKLTASFKTPRKSRVTVLAADGRPVAEISRAGFYNAHLVAAAPTMLALLVEIERKMAMMPEGDPVLLLAVRQAIKEAEARAGEANPRVRAWTITPEEKRVIDSAARGYLYAFTVGAEGSDEEAKAQRRMEKEFNADVGSLISGNIDPARQRAATAALRTLLEYTVEEDPSEGRHAILKALEARIASGDAAQNPSPGGQYDMQIVLPRISAQGRHLIEQILEEHGYDVDGGGTFMDGTCQSDIFLDAGKCFTGRAPKRVAVEWKEMMERVKEDENPKPGNPFAERAARARAEYERLGGETPHEKSMREAFPLGVGFSKPGGPQRRAEARIEATIDRAVKAQEALRLAESLESQAEAFDAGIIDAQGRRISEAMLVRREKKRPAKEAREARIAAAREQRAGKESWQVTRQVYGDASGYVAGGGRALVEYTHRGAVRDALIEGKPVPPEVLADYSDLASMTLEDLQRLRAEENPEKIVCAICGKLYTRRHPGFQIGSHYTFKETTWQGHKIVAPGHRGRTRYAMHVDSRGEWVAFTPLPHELTIHDNQGEIGGGAPPTPSSNPSTDECWYRVGDPSEYSEFTFNPGAEPGDYYSSAQMTGQRGSGIASGQYAFGKPDGKRVPVEPAKRPLRIIADKAPQELQEVAISMMRFAEGATEGYAHMRPSTAAWKIALLASAQVPGRSFEQQEKDFHQAVKDWSIHKKVHPVNILLHRWGFDGIEYVGEAAWAAEDGTYGNVKFPPMTDEGDVTGLVWCGPGRHDRFLCDPEAKLCASSNPEKREALIIVHLSSLDSYTGQVGYHEGETLASNMADAILEHEGPVYIIDQGWQTGYRDSQPREELLKQLKLRAPPSVWIKFDEDTDEWDPFLAKLRKRLKKDGVTNVVLGGMWYTPSLREGCVTEVLTKLRGHFPVRVDDQITGCVEEVEEAEEKATASSNPGMGAAPEKNPEWSSTDGGEEAEVGGVPLLVWQRSDGLWEWEVEVEPHREEAIPRRARYGDVEGTQAEARQAAEGRARRLGARENPDGRRSGGMTVHQQTAKTRQEEALAALETLQKKIIEAKDSQVFKDWLRFQGKFRSYSFNNTMLIMIQKPDATKLAGFRKWEELGRHVKLGERGILILCPSFRSREEFVRDPVTKEIETDPETGKPKIKEVTYLTGFRNGYIFDVSQTEGAPIPDLPVQATTGAEALPLLERAAVQVGAPVERRELRPGLGGWTDGKIIVLNGAYSPAAQAGVLAHELSHWIHGHPSMLQSGEVVHDSRSKIETEAEASAYVVNQRLGIDRKSEFYMASWDNPAALRESMDRIVSVSREILDAAEGATEGEACEIDAGSAAANPWHEEHAEDDLEENPTGPSGTCQVCFKRQKTRDGVMVLHGYKRPGHGYIVGNCWGTNYPPFEVSAERTKQFLAELRTIHTQKIEHLRKLQAQEIETLLYVPYQYWRQAAKPSVHVARGAARVQFPGHPEHVPSYEDLRTERIRETEQGLRYLSRDIQSYEKAVADWKPVPWPPAVPEPEKKRWSQWTALKTFAEYAKSKGYTIRVREDRFHNEAGEGMVMLRARGGEMTVAYGERTPEGRRALHKVPYPPEPEENPYNANPETVDRPWEMSASAYQSKIGVHAPWIGEVSPMQYAGLSGRGKAEYDEKRRREWDASAEAKREWRDLVMAAFERGEITSETPGLHPDAKSAIFYGLAEHRKAQEKLTMDQATEENRIHSVDELEVGDRVFDIMGHIYGTVSKKFKTSVRLDTQRWGPLTVPARRLQWLSYDEVERAVAEGRPVRPRPRPMSASANPEEITVERLLQFHIRAQEVGEKHHSRDVREPGMLVNLVEYHFPSVLEEHGDCPHRVAAEVGHYIVDRHPFWDCNHRTGWVAIGDLMDAAGYDVRAIPHEEVESMMRGIDQRGVTAEEIADWLRERAQPRALSWARKRGSDINRSSLSSGLRSGMGMQIGVGRASATRGNSSPEVYNPSRNPALSEIMRVLSLNAEMREFARAGYWDAVERNADYIKRILPESGIPPELVSGELGRASAAARARDLPGILNATAGIHLTIERAIGDVQIPEMLLLGAAPFPEKVVFTAEDIERMARESEENPTAMMVIREKAQWADENPSLWTWFRLWLFYRKLRKAVKKFDWQKVVKTAGEAIEYAKEKGVIPALLAPYVERLQAAVGKYDVAGVMKAISEVREKLAKLFEEIDIPKIIREGPSAIPKDVKQAFGEFIEEFGAKMQPAKNPLIMDNPGGMAKIVGERRERIVKAIRQAKLSPEKRPLKHESVWTNLVHLLGQRDADIAMMNLMWADPGFAPVKNPVARHRSVMVLRGIQRNPDSSSGRNVAMMVTRADRDA